MVQKFFENLCFYTCLVLKVLLESGAIVGLLFIIIQIFKCFLY